ncbi:hypothetical protein [Niallia sp. 03190]|uniref:hypothetical protein n=1 Tax=Niallia sp. 03190 TaxID=3458061 RepID=UPI00404407D3
MKWSDRLLDLVWYMSLYASIGIIRLFIAVITTPQGFILLDPRFAVTQIFLYPILIMKKVIY